VVWRNLYGAVAPALLRAPGWRVEQAAGAAPAVCAPGALSAGAAPPRVTCSAGSSGSSGRTTCCCAIAEDAVAARHSHPAGGGDPEGRSSHGRAAQRGEAEKV